MESIANQMLITEEEKTSKQLHEQHYPIINDFILHSAVPLEKIGFYLRKIFQNNPNKNSFMLQISKIYYNLNRNQDNLRWLINSAKNGNTTATLLLSRNSIIKSVPISLLNYICNENTYHFCDNFFINHLAIRYDKGIGGVAKNLETSKLWFERASQKGHPDSKAKIAKLIVDNEPERARQLVDEAMNSPIHYKWTRMVKVNFLLKGIYNDGVPNYNEAFNLLNYLIQEVPEYGLAKFRLALFYSGEYHAMIDDYPTFPRNPEDPNYIEINQSLAYNLYEQSHLSHHRSSLKLAQFYDPNFQHIIQFNITRTTNLLKAFNYYKIASDNGNENIYYVMGQFYENFGPYSGIVPLDIHTAIQFYNKGALKNEENCIERLTILQYHTQLIPEIENVPEQIIVN